MLKECQEAGVQGLELGGKRWSGSWEILEITDLNGA